jgi:hypothetical protein
MQPLAIVTDRIPELVHLRQLQHGADRERVMPRETDRVVIRACARDGIVGCPTTDQLGIGIDLKAGGS